MYLNIQKASIKIGPLECKGKSEAMNNGGSCQSLKSQGRSSGYYILDTSQDNRYTEDSYRYLKMRLFQGFLTCLNAKIVDTRDFQSWRERIFQKKKSLP